MADTKISALPAATTPLAGTEPVAIVQSGETRQATVAAFDRYTYVKLASNAITTGTANVATLLEIGSLLANTHYIFDGMLFLQSAATTTGARPGISWPSGTTQESAWIISPSSATAFTSRFWGAPTTQNAATTAMGVANEGFHGRVEGQFLTGASPSGVLAITIASEISGSEARIMANSWIRYRTI